VAAELTVIIPTRNRAELAMRAVQSVLGQIGNSATRIVLSDNSTEPAQSSMLEKFASDINNKHFALIRPDKSLAMTAHWSWAFDQVMRESGTSHLTILTDRMLFRPGALHSILEIVEKYPSQVISYTYDRIDDFATPVVYRPLPRSGHLLRIDSAHLLQMSARMDFPSCLPRMLNSVAPRATLERMRERFGSVFSSVAPDFCYCYRCLELEESIVYYDRSILLNHAQDRSNGAAASRGVSSKDNRDFLLNVAKNELNAYTPIPKIITVGNAVVNEYTFVAKESGSPKFPPIAKEYYLDHLAKEAGEYMNPELANEVFRCLKENGWRPRRDFFLNRLKRKLGSFVLYVLAKKFNSKIEAIEYAIDARPKVYPFFFYSKRKFNAVRID